MELFHIYYGSDGEGREKKNIKLQIHTFYCWYNGNWHVRPMKWLTFLAGLLCWRACWSYLTELSRRCPPTQHQVQMYYVTFISYMGWDRDNSDITFKKYTMPGKSRNQKEISLLEEKVHKVWVPMHWFWQWETSQWNSILRIQDMKMLKG